MNPNLVELVFTSNNKIREHLVAQAIENKGTKTSVDKIKQKTAVHLPDNQSVFINQSAPFSHIFGCDAEQNQTGDKPKSGKKLFNPQLSYNKT